MAKPYIATRPIYEPGGTGLAYAVGSEVAPEVVEAYGLHESVSREGTKAAESAKPDVKP